MVEVVVGLMEEAPLMVGTATTNVARMIVVSPDRTVKPLRMPSKAPEARVKI